MQGIKKTHTEVITLVEYVKSELSPLAYM